eukprot:5154520-Prymnesium_polylepis.1
MRSGAFMGAASSATGRSGVAELGNDALDPSWLEFLDYRERTCSFVDLTLLQGVPPALQPERIHFHGACVIVCATCAHACAAGGRRLTSP